MATGTVSSLSLFADAPVTPTTLDIANDHPVARRIMAGAEPGIFALHRSYDEKRKRFKQNITVDDALIPIIIDEIPILAVAGMFAGFAGVGLTVGVAP